MASQRTQLPAHRPGITYQCPQPLVAFKIATGGASQNGLLQALAQAFIKSIPFPNQRAPIAIECFTSDTSETIDQLRQNLVDVGITAHAVAEKTALREGFVDRVEYMWRDRWMLVGPRENPAGLSKNKKGPVYNLFIDLFSAMENSKNEDRPIRYLSRYDSSANNLAESAVWVKIGQTPWAPPRPPWYHMLVDYPLQALQTAAELGEYTLTDFCSWNTIESETREQMEIFAEGKGDEYDPLHNPAHLLVGTASPNRHMADKFADWAVREDGGQAVIRGFQKNGIQLTRTAPIGVDPLGTVNELLDGTS